MISVIPFRIPIPEMLFPFGSSIVTLRDFGEMNGTAPLIGLADTPLSLGRIDPSATKAASPLSESASRIAFWLSASSILEETSDGLYAL